MPQIELHMPKGAITQEAKAQLCEDLTYLLLKMEGAPATPEALAITWCYVNEYEPENMTVGGRPLRYPVYRCVLTIPEGATGFHGPVMRGRRDAMVRKTTALILGAEGAEVTPANTGRVWCQIVEIADQFWGGYGEIADCVDVASYIGAPLIREPSERGLRAREAYKALAEIYPPLTPRKQEVKTPPKPNPQGGTDSMTIDGTWNIEMGSPLGEKSGTLSVASNGGEITGDLHSDMGEATTYDGTIEGDAASFKADITSPMPMTLEFTGQLAEDTISGKVSVGSFGEHEFSGTRAS